MNIQRIKAEKLIPAEYNPRKNLKKSDAEYKKIERSVQEFGYVDPIIVNKDMTIIGGHQRYKVLVDLGYDELDCVVVDLPKDREKALNVALNKISGEWDEALLIEMLGDLGDLAELTGFDAEEIDKLLDNKAEVKEDDFDSDAAVAAIVEPITKRGDIWQLGRHRLMCGDSTMIDDVDKLMEGKKADMVFTDPPYNIAYEGGTKKREMIKNDQVDDFYTFLFNAFSNMLLVSKAGASAYITHADTERCNFTKAFMDAGFYLSSVIIWVKNNSTFGRQDYNWKHEPILYGWNAKGGHKFFGSAKEDTVWLIDRPSRSDEHPTMKPIPLIARAINNSSKTDDYILDLFGGSGSTLIACEQLNRICYMMELDPKYCDVIIKRWEEFTGQKAELIS